MIGSRIAAIARGLVVVVRDAVLLLFMMAFTSAGLVRAQESSPEPQTEQTSQEEEAGAEVKAKPAAGNALPPVEVLQGAETSSDSEPDAESAAESQPAVRPRPAAAATPRPRPRQTTAQVQTAVPTPLPEPEPEGVERGTYEGEPTAYSPVEGYVATRSATGMKTDTPLIETPQSISVIGVEQMEDQGVQTLQEALRYTPGVFADGFGVDTRVDFPIVRGLPASLFIDGLQNTPPGGNYFNTIQIEPYALERIEVLRGPSAMTYGATSAGGIVNGISKRPTLEPLAEVGVDYGSFDFRQIRGDVGGPISENGDWYYRITGLGRLADTQVDYVDNDRYMIQPALSYRPDGDTDVTLITNFRKDDSGSTQQFMPQAGTLYPNVNGRIIPRDTFTGVPSDHFDTEQQSGTLLIDKTFNDRWKFHTGMRFTNNENEYDTTLPALLTPARLSIINAPFQSFLGTNLITDDYAPFLDPDQEEVARVRFIQKTDTEVFNQDTYLTGNFATGGLTHEVTGGVDFMGFKQQVKRGQTLDNLITSTSVDDGVVTAAEAAALEQALAFAYSQIPSGLPPFLLPFARAQAEAGAAAFVGGLGINRQFVLQQAGYPGYQQKFNLYNPNYGRSDYQIDLNTFGIVDPNNVPLYDDPEERQYQTGLYIQDQLRWGNWIGVLGIRQDWVNIEFDGSPDAHEQATSGRAALMYEFNAGIAPYVAWSQSFTPQPGTIVSDDLFIPLNRRAATPREGEQIEVGLKIQPEGSRYAVNLAAYELTEDNRVVSPDTLFETLIGGSTRVRGFEFEAMGHVTDELRILAAYTYTDAEWTDYPDPLGIKAGTQLEGMPPHLASLWGIYSFSRGWLDGFSVGAGVRYLGEIDDVAIDIISGQRLEVTTPSVTLVDASLSYETDHWRWDVTGQNLEDKYYVVNCQAFRGDCAIGQARTIIASATYKY